MSDVCRTKHTHTHKIHAQAEQTMAQRAGALNSANTRAPHICFINHNHIAKPQYKHVRHHEQRPSYCLRTEMCETCKWCVCLFSLEACLKYACFCTYARPVKVCTEQAVLVVLRYFVNKLRGAF